MEWIILLYPLLTAWVFYCANVCKATMLRGSSYINPRLIQFHHNPQMFYTPVFRRILYSPRRRTYMPTQKRHKSLNFDYFLPIHTKLFSLKDRSKFINKLFEQRKLVPQSGYHGMHVPTMVDYYSDFSNGLRKEGLTVPESNSWMSFDGEWSSAVWEESDAEEYELC